MKKKFVVRQHDLKDCGVCSLLSIIKYYDGYVPLEKLRIDTHTSMEGTTAYDLVKTALNYGFDSYGVKLDSLKELENLILPAIAHVVINNLNHFVVIYKINKDYITIMDPAKGIVKYKANDFANIWSKNIIILYPKYQIPKSSNQNQVFSIIKNIFKKEKTLLFKITLFTALFTFLTICTGFYYKIGMNFLSENDEKGTLFLIVFLFLILYLTKFVIYYLRTYFKRWFNHHFDGILYYNFLQHLFMLPNYFIKDRTTGEIMIRLKELENIKDVFSELVITIFLDSILAFSVGCILLYINKTLFLILCFICFLYVVHGIITGRRVYKKALDVTEKEVLFQSTATENVESFLTIKNLNIGNKMFQKIEKVLIKYLTSLHDLNAKILNANVLSYSLEEILHFAILSVGFLAIGNHKMELIDLITFESLVEFFLSPCKNIIGIIPNYSYVKVNIEKMNDFYNVEEEQTNIGFNTFVNGDIEIKNLSFSYTPVVPIFNNFHLQIPKNKFVFFKGPSGCGKSTLCQIICGLIKTPNAITIGNVYIEDYSLDTLRKNITYVSQKEKLLQDTIKNNILLDREVEEEKLREIASICEIESLIAKKPLRYETFLMKDAMNISGGEKQRIILARALLNDFQILILDEALSELNNELEIKIIKNLKKYLHDKTVIYVSHKNHEKYFDKVYNFGSEQ